MCKSDEELIDENLDKLEDALKSLGHNEYELDQDNKTIKFRDWSTDIIIKAERDNYELSIVTNHDSLENLLEHISIHNIL